MHTASWRILCLVYNLSGLVSLVRFSTKLDIIFVIFCFPYCTQSLILEQFLLEGISHETKRTKSILVMHLSEYTLFAGRSICTLMGISQFLAGRGTCTFKQMRPLFCATRDIYFWHLSRFDTLFCDEAPLLVTFMRVWTLS